MSVEILENNVIGKYIVATRDFKAGEEVLSVPGPLQKTPTVYTIQIDDGLHVDIVSPMCFTPHSCNPTVRIKTPDVIPEFVEGATGVVVLVAVRDIAKGDIVAFDYCTSETQMAAPFPCSCGAPWCRKEIQGFDPLWKVNAAAALALLPQCTHVVRKRCVKNVKEALAALSDEKKSSLIAEEDVAATVEAAAKGDSDALAKLTAVVA